MNGHARGGCARFLHLFSTAELPLAGLILAAMLARMIWTAYTGHTFEDAYITFQYARRLAEGQGFVYNPGERVYGTTTPLFALLLAGWLLASGGGVVLGARLLDFAAAGGAIVLAWLTLRRAGSSPAQQFFTLALFCLSSKLWLMDSGGMETPLAICLMAAAWFAYAAGRAGWAGLLAGLLLWTRIDLALWSFVLVLAEALRRPRNALRLAFTASLVYLPWVILATLYFGSPVPHTVVAKWAAYVQHNREPLAAQAWAVFKYLSPFEIPYEFRRATSLLSALTLGAAAAGSWRIWRDRQLGVLPVFVLLEAVRLVLTRATVFNRYLVPTLWATLILAGLGLGRAWDRTRAGPRPARFALALALAAVLAFGAALGIRRAQETRNTQLYRHEAALTGIGVWLYQNTPPETTVLLEPLGYAGYYADRIMLDEVGLVTPQITRLKSQGLFDVYEYLPILQPEAVVIHCDDSLPWQMRSADGGNLFTARYAWAVTFNPLNFDPSPDAPVDPRPPAVLARNACYEIWTRVSGP